MIIKQKCSSEIFKRIEEGKKNSFVGVVDNKVKEGDFLVFQEFDSVKKKYTGRKIKKKIRGVSRSASHHLYWSEEDRKKGFTILLFD